jgi:hypothetical protein
MIRLAKIVGCTLAFLIVFDIAGALVSLFFEIVPLLGVSRPLFYAIWFVAGVFCGLFSYNSAGQLASPKADDFEAARNKAAGKKEKEEDWSNRADSGQTGLLVIFTTAAVLVPLSLLFYHLWWQYFRSSSNYVPDDGPLSLTFFITVLASTIFAHTNFRSPSKPNTSA